MFFNLHSAWFREGWDVVDLGNPYIVLMIYEKALDLSIRKLVRFFGTAHRFKSARRRVRVVIQEEKPSKRR
jgi:hypothetical protein